jgi:ABC-type multidrug transport system fused ATPase/permease subunit
MQPISIFVSKNYGSSQLAVMAARDDKTHIITEVLHGIRQIKFSALEDKWQALIMETRATELKAQSRVYSWTILLLMTWLSMPILLGAVGLSLYVWISKTMLASVAFTALSVFSTLEFTLSAVPINIAKLLDARISCIRIQQHLALPDKEISRGTNESISFYGAKLQWPCYNKNEASFSLSGVSLRFPPQKLRYVSISVYFASDTNFLQSHPRENRSR